MAAFEYDITLHSSQQLSQVVYFCNEKGQCDISGIPESQTKAFVEILNDRGSQGWEAVQVISGKDGLMVIWKRALQDEAS
jgi:hypothetical protein